MSGCSDSNRRENFKNSLTIILETESVVWGNVSSTWQSGSEKVIKVSYPDQSKNKGGIVYVEIRDKYFGSLDPKVGDCVAVWITSYVYKDGQIRHGMAHPDRNIIHCEG